MRVLAGLLLVAAAGACTSSTHSDTTLSPPLDTPAASVVTDQLLAELDLERLAAPVSRLRELEFLEPVSVRIIEDADYQARVAELAAAPLGLAPDIHSQWFRLLDVLPKDSTADTATRRLLQTAVAIYDHTANQVLVRSSAGVDPYVESVVVHELVHALQHQHFGRADGRLFDGDLGYVYRALIEGDAERVSRRFIGELSQADEFAYEEGRLAAHEDATAIRASTPSFIVDSLSQPADYGVRFLQGVDYATVDGFFADLAGLTSLPPSSEAVIFRDANLEIPVLELSPPMVPPYEPVSVEGTLGVGRLRLILGLGLDDKPITQAIQGWEADRLDVRASGDDVIFTYLFAGDQAEDAGELATAFRTLLDTSLAPGAYGSVRVAGNQVLVLAASDPSLQDRLEELYGEFGEEVFLVPPG